MILSGGLGRCCGRETADQVGHEPRDYAELFVEDRLNDDFRTLWVDNLSRESAVDSLFGIIERGKARGDVDVTVPTAVVLRSVLGGVEQQLAASTAQTGTVFTSAEGLAYLDALVDSVLRASRPQTERRREE